MNKKLLAIAVGAAMVAGSAAVMADATVYGKINVGIVSYDNDQTVAGGGIANDGLGVFDESSRLGVKGEEDLGNGLTGYFKMEGTVDMDNGGDFNFNRDRYIGIKGGFGSVQMGQFNTAYKNTTGKMDIFADRFGDITGSGIHSTFDLREPNMVGYSNKFGSVKFAADVSFSEAADDKTTRTVDEGAMGMSIGINVPVGPVELAVAHAVRNGTAESSSGASLEGNNATKLAVQWKGPVLVNAWYEMMTNEHVLTDADTNVMTLQVAKTMDANTFGISYSAAEPDAADKSCTQMSAGVMHKLGKKTEVNVIYSVIDNDDVAKCVGRFGAVGGSAFSTSTTGDSTGNGASPAALAIGFQHNF